MATPVSSRFPGAPCPSQRVIHKSLLYELDTTPFLSTSPKEGITGWDYFGENSGLGGKLVYQYPVRGDKQYGYDVTSSMLDGLEHFVYPEGISLSATPKPQQQHSFVLVGAANMPPIAYKQPQAELPIPQTTPISPPCYCFVITQWSLVNSDVTATIKLQIASDMMSSSLDMDALQTMQAPEQIYAPKSIAVISTHSFGSVINEILLRTTKDCLFDADLTQYQFSLFHNIPITVAIALGTPSEATRKIVKAPLDCHDHSLQQFNTDGFSKGCYSGYAPSANKLTEGLDESSETPLDIDSNRPLILTPLHGLPLFAPPPGVIASTLPAFTFPPYPFNTAPMLDPAWAAIYASRMSPTNTIHLLSALCSGLSIVLVSDDVSCITPCFEALLSFLYPLQYPYVYIPLLPQTMLEVVSAPLPYLVGVTGKIFEQLEFDTQVIIAHLDDDTVESIVDGETRVFPPPMQHPTHSVWTKGEADVYVPSLAPHGGFAMNGYISQLRDNTDTQEQVQKQGLFEYEWGQSKAKKSRSVIPLHSHHHPLRSWLKVPHDEEVFLQKEEDESDHEFLYEDENVEKPENPPYQRRKRIMNGLASTTDVVLASVDNIAACQKDKITNVEELLSLPQHPDPIHFSHACRICLNQRISQEATYLTPDLPVEMSRKVCVECCSLPQNVPTISDMSLGSFTAMTALLGYSAQDEKDSQAVLPNITHSHTNILGSAVQLICALTLQKTNDTYINAVETGRLTKSLAMCLPEESSIEQMTSMHFSAPPIEELDMNNMFNAPTNSYTPPPLPLAQRDCSPMGFRRLPWRIAWRMQAHLVKLAAVLPSLPFLSQHSRTLLETHSTNQNPTPATHFDFFPIYSVYLSELLARKPTNMNLVRKYVRDVPDENHITNAFHTNTNDNISISIDIPNTPASPPPKMKAHKPSNIMTSPPANKIVESMEFTLDNKYNCKQVVSQYATVEWSGDSGNLAPKIPAGRILDNLPSNSSHVVSHTTHHLRALNQEQMGSPRSIVSQTIDKPILMDGQPFTPSPATPRMSMPVVPASVTHKNSAYSVTYTFQEGSSVAAQLQKSNSFAVSYNGQPASNQEHTSFTDPQQSSISSGPLLSQSQSLDVSLPTQNIFTSAISNEHPTSNEPEYHVSTDGHIVMEQDINLQAPRHALANIPAPHISTSLSPSTSSTGSVNSQNSDTASGSTKTGSSLPLSPSFHKSVSQATLRTASGVTTVTVTGNKIVQQMKNIPTSANVNVNVARALPVSVSAQIPCSLDLITMANIVPVYVTPVAFAHAIELSLNDTSLYAHITAPTNTTRNEEEPNFIASEPIYTVSSDLHKSGCNNTLDDTMTIGVDHDEQADHVELPNVLSTVNVSNNTWTDITKQFDRSLGMSASMQNVDSRRELFNANTSLAKLIPKQNLSVPEEGRNMNVLKDSLRSVMGKEVIPNNYDMSVLTLDAVEALHSDGDVSDTFEDETALYYCVEELPDVKAERSVDDDLHSEMLLLDVQTDVNPFLRDTPLPLKFWSSTWRNSPHCVSLPVLLRLRQGVVSAWTSLLDTITCNARLEYEPLSLHEYNLFQSNLSNTDCTLPEPVLKESVSPMRILQCAQKKDSAFVPFVSAFIDQNQMASVFQLTRTSPLLSAESVLQWVRLWADIGHVYKDHQRWRLFQHFCNLVGDGKTPLGLHIPHPIFTSVPGPSSCPSTSQAALWSMICSAHGRPLKYNIVTNQAESVDKASKIPNIHTLLDLSYTNAKNIPKSLLPLLLALRSTAPAEPRLADWYSLISLAQANRVASSTAILEPVVGTLYLRKVGLFTSWEDFTFYLGDSTDPYALVYYKPTQQLHDAERLYSTALHRFQKATSDAMSASQTSKGSSILSQFDSAKDIAKAAVLQAQMQRNQIRQQHKVGQINLTKKMWLGIPNPQSHTSLPSPYLFEQRVDPADVVASTALQSILPNLHISHALKNISKYLTKEHVLMDLVRNPFPFGTSHVSLPMSQYLPNVELQTQPQIFNCFPTIMDSLYPSLYPFIARGLLQGHGSDAQLPASLLAPMTPAILLEKHHFYSPSRVTLTTATQQRPKRTPTKCTDHYALSQVFFASLPSHITALHHIPFVQGYNEALHPLRYIDSTRGISDKELSRLEEMQIADSMGSPMQFTPFEATNILRTYLAPLIASPTLLMRTCTGKPLVVKTVMSNIKGDADNVPILSTSLSSSEQASAYPLSPSPSNHVLPAPSLSLSPSDMFHEPSHNTSHANSKSKGFASLLPPTSPSVPMSPTSSLAPRKKNMHVMSPEDLELTKVIAAFAPLTPQAFTNLAKQVQTSVYSSVCLVSTNACTSEEYLQLLLFSMSGAPEAAVPECEDIVEEDTDLQSVDVIPSPEPSATVSVSLCASDTATRTKWIRAIRARTTLLQPVKPGKPTNTNQEVLQSPEVLEKVAHLLLETPVAERTGDTLTNCLVMLLSFVSLKNQATNAWLVLILNVLAKYIGATPAQLLHSAHTNSLQGSPLSTVLCLLPRAIHVAMHPPLSLLQLQNTNVNITLKQLAMIPKSLLPPMLNPCTSLEVLTKEYMCNHKLLASALLYDLQKCISTVQSVVNVMKRQVVLCVLKTLYSIDAIASEQVFFPNPANERLPRPTASPCTSCSCCNTASHNDVLSCSQPLRISFNAEWLYTRVCAAVFEQVNLYHHLLLASIEELPLQANEQTKAVLYKASMSHVLLTNLQITDILGPNSMLLRDTMHTLALTMFYPRYCMHNGSTSQSFIHYTAFLQLFMHTNVEDSIKLANIALSLNCITPTNLPTSSCVDVASSLTCNNPEQVCAQYKLMRDQNTTGPTNTGKLVKMMQCQTTLHSTIEFLPYRQGYVNLYCTAPYSMIDELSFFQSHAGNHTFEELLSATQIKSICYSLGSSSTFKAWYIHSPLFSHTYSNNYTPSVHTKPVTTLPILLPYHPVHLYVGSKVYFDATKYTYNTLVRATNIIINPHTMNRSVPHLVLDHCLCESTYSLSYTDITLAYILHQIWPTLSLIQARKVKCHDMVPNTQTVANASNIITKLIQVKVCQTDTEVISILNRLAKVNVLLHVSVNPYRLDDLEEPICYCREETEITNSLVDYYYLQAPRTYMG